MEGGPAALQAHAAGAGRELAQSEAGGLKASADREQANAEAEWRQLTQLLEHARRQRVRRPRSPNLHAHSINHMRGTAWFAPCSNPSQCMLAVAECAQILYPRARCARVQEAKRNREIEVRDLQTATVLSSEVGPRRRTASPGASGGGARGGGATAADRLRELGAAFDAVLAATGAHPAGPMRRVVLRWRPPARALPAPCAGWLPRRRQARMPYQHNRLLSHASEKK